MSGNCSAWRKLRVSAMDFLVSLRKRKQAIASSWMEFLRWCLKEAKGLFLR